MLSDKHQRFELIEKYPNSPPVGTIATETIIACLDRIKGQTSQKKQYLYWVSEDSHERVYLEPKEVENNKCWRNVEKTN